MRYPSSGGAVSVKPAALAARIGVFRVNAASLGMAMPHKRASMGILRLVPSHAYAAARRAFIRSLPREDVDEALHFRQLTQPVIQKSRILRFTPWIISRDYFTSIRISTVHGSGRVGVPAVRNASIASQPPTAGGRRSQWGGSVECRFPYRHTMKL